MDKPLVEIPTDITPRVVITPDFTGATDEEREQGICEYFSGNRSPTPPFKLPI
jgi:hypothetical protein